MKRHVKTMMAAVLLVAMAFVVGCKKTDDSNNGENGGNGGGDTPDPGEVIDGPDLMTFTVNGVSFDMIKVEGGTFWMGAQSTDQNGQNYDEQASESESPVHQVALSDYYIGKYEVSQELWQAVMGTNPSHFQGELLPVENVGPNSIQDFLHTLNVRLSGEINGLQFRLPSEAQWEFAAKGGKESHGYKYSGNNNSNIVAWYSSNSGNQTHPIGSKEPNELFVYDMSGNVAEWCNDYAGGYVGVSQTDPIGPSQEFMGEDPGWIVRGGSWKSGIDYCRSSSRDAWNKGESLIGFRLVLCGNVGQATVPGPKTGSVSDITTNSAHVTGSLWTDGGSFQTEWGFCYGTSPDLAANGTKIPVSEFEHNYNYSGSLINLQPGTKYYFCAYAENAIGTGYGEVVEFITLENIRIITSTITNITDFTAIGGGNVISDGGSAVTERGLCWDTNHNPTVENAHVSHGTGLGAYSVNITELWPGTTYYARAYAVNILGIVYGDEVTFVTTVDDPNGHDWVDLGLPSGTLWAICNVGASVPEGYGDYFAWGETQPKSSYLWSTYKYCNGSSRTLTKYCGNSSYGYNGFTDNLTILQPVDDAAMANWGSGWCTPSIGQWQELQVHTTQLFTIQNGVNGVLFTANNGNSLFIPIEGDSGHYWSNSFDKNDYPSMAASFSFSLEYHAMIPFLEDRKSGFPVRPVRYSIQNYLPRY